MASLLLVVVLCDNNYIKYELLLVTITDIEGEFVWLTEAPIQLM